MSSSGLSTIRLASGGWVTGQIVGSDDERLEMTVSKFAGTRGLVDPTPGAVVPIPLNLVVGVDAGDAP
jgi:hypothetical protein